MLQREMYYTLLKYLGFQGSFSEFADKDHAHPPIIPTSITSDSTENLLSPPSTATLYSQKCLVKKFPGVVVIVLYTLLVVSFLMFWRMHNKISESKWKLFHFQIVVLFYVLL